MKKFLLEIWYLFRYNRSYAQDGEDIIFQEFWKAEYGNAAGFFVEIGGYHPVRFSNTLRLYQSGWNGIVIEPTPAKWWLFALMRPRDILVKLAAGTQKQIKPFFCFPVAALNKFATEIREYKTREFIPRMLPVQQDTLENILSEKLPENKVIDLLSIDIEGLELDVLKSNDWRKYSPKFIIVEDHQFEIQCPERSKTHNFLTKMNYLAIARTRRNTIYQIAKQLPGR